MSDISRYPGCAVRLNQESPAFSAGECQNGTIYFVGGGFAWYAVRTDGMPLWSVMVQGALNGLVFDSGMIYTGAADTVDGRISAVTTG